MATHYDATLSLPFFKDEKLLPAPIPDIVSIRSSQVIFTGNETSAPRRVVAVGSHYLVKYGRVSAIEGQNLLFVERYAAEVPAPRLFAAWEEPGPFNEYFEGPYLVLVMELLQGESLEQKWPHLTISDKDIILRKLKVVFDDLRRLTTVGGFCNVSGGPLPHYMFTAYRGDAEISGPFTEGRQFVGALAKRSRLNWQDNSQYCCLADFYERAFTPTFERHKPVLTHSDVQRKNIVVQEIRENTGTVDWKVMLVDWEASGWYPECWEYFTAFLCFRWCEDDWPILVDRFLRPYAPEATMLKMIHQDLFW